MPILNSNTMVTIGQKYELEGKQFTYVGMKGRVSHYFVRDSDKVEIAILSFELANLLTEGTIKQIKP